MPLHSTSRTSGSTYRVAFFLTFIATISLFQAAAAVSDEDAEARKQKREMAKPWYLKSAMIGGVKLPFSPVSIFTICLVLLNLYYTLLAPSGAFAEACHILVEDEAAANRLKLKVGNDFAKFQDAATKYSTCPSRNDGGNLGKFKPGDMAPPFDRVIFNPESPVHVTLGPIQTSFGWHLIFIERRKL